jgi:hypothetical protein
MSMLLRIFPLAAVATALIAAAPVPDATLQPTVATIALGSTISSPKPRPIETVPGPGFTAAPTPNQDATIPFVKDPRADQAQLGPSVFAPPPKGYRGEGYVPGSTVDGEQQRRIKPAPGINLTVPLN